jgi:thiamine-phosphate pyrophosphorylase
MPPPLPNALTAARLYGILDTGYAPPADWPRLALALIRGGVGVLQIRAKNHTPDEIARWTESVLPITRGAAIPLIINDHPALVPQTGADGCHVGQDGGPLAEARALAGPGALVGRSTHSLDQARAAQDEGADYIGFGPIFPTPTKPGRQAIGPEAIRAMSESIALPAFCIGGIHPGNLRSLVALGARRVVIVSALLMAPDPEATAREALGLLP